METEPKSRVVAAEKLSGGGIISFDDGKSALYSASLLHALFSQADELIPVEWPED